MPDIIYWEHDGVINAMSSLGYESRDRQERLIEKYWRAGSSKEQARNLARKEIPDPTIITFTTDRYDAYISPTGVYGHAGPRELFDQLVTASGRKLIKRVMKIRNANNNWSVVAPTSREIEAVFGPDAIPAYWHYRQSRGLDY